MNFLSVLTLSVGLAMDATAVASTRGMLARTFRWRDVLLVAGLFGGFQAAMPLAGWLVGAAFGSVVEAWDHWIAFVLLGGLGVKMLWEAWRGDDDEKVEAEPFQLKLLLALSVATSIDALAAGFTLPLLQAPFAVSIATIGVTTAVLSGLGVIAGRKFGALLGKKLDVLGGVILIGLGAKILVEHLTAS